MEQEERRLRRRLFFISFAVASLLLSVAAMAVVLFTTGSSGTPSGSAAEQAAYLPREEDCMTVLFIGADTASHANTFMLLRFDPVRGQIPVLSLSGSTLLTAGDRVTTLAESWRDGGPAAACGQLGRALGITVDRYVQVSESSFIRALEALGTVRYELKTPILCETGSHLLRLPQGEQLLGGQAVCALIRHTGYRGGELGRTSAATALACSAINEKAALLFSERSEAIFTFSIDLVESDLTYADYQSRIPAAAFLLRYAPQPATAVPVLGSVDAGGRFVLSDPSVRTIRSIYAPQFTPAL